ncbi:hypothetical protein GVAV_000226 [Gurleya vavrai]
MNNTGFERIIEERNRKTREKINLIFEKRLAERKNLLKEIEEINKRIKLENEIFIKKNEIEPNTSNDFIREQNKEQELELKNDDFKTKQDKIKTNIPFSQELISLYINDNITDLELYKEKNKEEYLDIKRIVNKRMMQLSSELEHIQEISKVLMKYKDNDSFIEIFTSKIIEQSKLQVKNQKEFYKVLAYLFYLLRTDKLFLYYRFKIVTVDCDDNLALRSIYYVYFGVLKLANLYQEAWFFLASILNEKPIEKTLYVLDAFIIVLGIKMKEFYGSEFCKLEEYIFVNFFPLFDNDAIKTRIVNAFNAVK